MDQWAYSMVRQLHSHDLPIDNPPLGDVVILPIHYVIVSSENFKNSNSWFDLIAATNLSQDFTNSKYCMRCKCETVIAVRQSNKLEGYRTSKGLFSAEVRRFQVIGWREGDR